MVQPLLCILKEEIIFQSQIKARIKEDVGS